MQLETLAASIDIYKRRAVYAMAKLTLQYIPVSAKKTPVLLTAAKNLDVCLMFRGDAELP
jgi:hypothetical protein